MHTLTKQNFILFCSNNESSPRVELKILNKKICGNFATYLPTSSHFVLEEIIEMSPGQSCLLKAVASVCVGVGGGGGVVIWGHVLLNQQHARMHLHQPHATVG